MTTILDLAPDELLSTTRAVRRRLDLTRPVPLELARECVELAAQAPTASNQQNWHFVVVADAEKRAAIGAVYARAFDIYREMPFAAGKLFQDDPARAPVQRRVMTSAEYLAAHMGEVPLMVIPCIETRVDGQPAFASASVWGSLFPAVWNFMLAARARSLGTSWTSLHLMFEQEVADVLGIPFDTVSQGALIPVGYTIGTEFKPGPRRPVDDILHVDSW